MLTVHTVPASDPGTLTATCGQALNGRDHTGRLPDDADLWAELARQDGDAVCPKCAEVA